MRVSECVKYTPTWKQQSQTGEVSIKLTSHSLVPTIRILISKTFKMFLNKSTTPFARSLARRSCATRHLATVPLKEGDCVPNIIFRARVRDEKIGGPNPFTWKSVSTNDLFKGKRSVVFALPGGNLCINWIAG